MGRRPQKNRHQHQKRRQTVKKNETQPATVVTHTASEKLPVTKPAKRDTISKIDFFGFPASVFTADLRRTGWATLVILVILGLVVVFAGR